MVRRAGRDAGQHRLGSGAGGKHRRHTGGGTHEETGLINYRCGSVVCGNAVTVTVRMASVRRAVGRMGEGRRASCAIQRLQFALRDERMGAN